MKNWKEYVGYTNDLQEQRVVNIDGKEMLSTFYLQVNRERMNELEENNSATPISISVLRERIPVENICLTDEEVGTKIEELLSSFPLIEKNDFLSIEQAKLNVAKETRRGIATTNHNNTFWYKGTSAMDSPIIVTEHDEKYHVFKHPEFEKYGFNVPEKNDPDRSIIKVDVGNIDGTQALELINRVREEFNNDKSNNLQ